MGFWHGWLNINPAQMEINRSAEEFNTDFIWLKNEIKTIVYGTPNWQSAELYWP